MLNFSEIKTLAIPILMKYKVGKAYLFGAFSRNEQTSDSDIDFLIVYKSDARPTLFELGALKFELEDLFKRKVDIITEAAASTYLKPYIMAGIKEIL